MAGLVLLAMACGGHGDEFVAPVPVSEPRVSDRDAEATLELQPWPSPTVSPYLGREAQRIVVDYMKSTRNPVSWEITYAILNNEMLGPGQYGGDFEDRLGWRVVREIGEGLEVEAGEVESLGGLKYGVPVTVEGTVPIGMKNVESVSVYAPFYLVVDMDRDKMFEYELLRVDDDWEVDVAGMEVSSVRVAMEGVR